MRSLWPILLVLLPAFAPLGLAQVGGGDSDGDDDRSSRGSDDPEGSSDDKRLDEVEREVKVSVSGGKAEVKLERKGGGSEDEVKVELNGPESYLRISYETENATAETETELKVKLREVIEFADNDSDGAYDPGLDVLVARHAAEGLRWSLAPPTDVVSADGVGGKRLVATGEFPQGGSLGLVLFVYGDFATVNGTSLRPTDAKLDILLDRFPYVRNDTAAALLVKTEWKAESETENEEGARGDDVRGVSAASAGARAYFTWSDVALVDGVERPVGTTAVASASKEKEGETKTKDTFWFAYPRGTLVNHDPVLGVQSADDRPVEKGTPGFAPVLVLAAAATGAVLLRSRRRDA